MAEDRELQPPEVAGLPPTQWQAQLEGTVHAASGVTRLFQSNALERDTLFVFATPTVL